LRVLARTPAYTPHALALHPRVSPELAERLRQAFTSLNGDEAGRALLAPLSFKGLVAATDAEWDAVRALKLKQPVGSTAARR
jgi:phosphonate transport system substrate-binding protein